MAYLTSSAASFAFQGITIADRLAASLTKLTPCPGRMLTRLIVPDSGIIPTIIRRARGKADEAALQRPYGDEILSTPGWPTPPLTPMLLK